MQKVLSCGVILLLLYFLYHGSKITEQIGGIGSTVVNMKNHQFIPKDIIVKLGNTVTWKNTDTIPHTVTFKGLAMDSGNMKPGDSVDFIFNTPGIFDYFCAYHLNMGMVGSVTVE